MGDRYVISVRGPRHFLAGSSAIRNNGRWHRLLEHVSMRSGKKRDGADRVEDLNAAG